MLLLDLIELEIVKYVTKVIGESGDTSQSDCAPASNEVIDNNLNIFRTLEIRWLVGILLNT